MPDPIYDKHGDSVLQETWRLNKTDTIIKLFDFNAREITTIHNHTVEKVERTYGRDQQLSTNLASNSDVTVKNFSDLEDKRAIELAHRKLVELGGNPGPLQKTVAKPKPPRTPG